MPTGPPKICKTDANVLMSPLHDRMLVILPVRSSTTGSTPDVSDAAELKPLLAQYPSAAMRYWSVARRMGPSDVNDDHVTDPVAEDAAAAPPAAKAQRNLFGE